MRNKKNKEVQKHIVYKHGIQSHDAHRHYTLLIKRRCAIISNMEITNMKGGRISKYKKALIDREIIPKRLPVRSPKITRRVLRDCRGAVRIQLKRKSQRQRGIKYPEEKILTRV
jgi:hypothetical protein